VLLLSPLHCYQVLLLIRHVVNAITRSIALLMILLVCHVVGVGLLLLMLLVRHVANDATCLLCCWRWSYLSIVFPSTHLSHSPYVLVVPSRCQLLFPLHYICFGEVLPPSSSPCKWGIGGPSR